MAYIPPNKRSSNKKGRHATRPATRITTDEFPALGAPIVSHNSMTGNYATAVKTEEPVPDEEERVEPGWVVFKRDRKTGKIERKGEPHASPDNEDDRRKVVLKNMINSWQQYRDESTEVFDQSSPYWGMKNLNAPLSDDDLSEAESDNDSESESDDNEFSDGWASN